MRRIFLPVIVLLLLPCLRMNAQVCSFRSSDTGLVAVFQWAEQTAGSYRGAGTDPVGPWYEAALPAREAFCIRDVGHQCIGAEILGWSAENYNMLQKWVSNISASKNWCSYWEMNRWNKPAPVDYRNDQEFWYNLNANFELIYASLRLYQWTGDRRYISSPEFLNFFEKTLNEYIREWILQPDSLLSRRAMPFLPASYDAGNYYVTSRGIPSYVESVPGLRMTADLLAAIYQAFQSMAQIRFYLGDSIRAKALLKQAERYQNHMEKYWKKPDGSYYTYYLTDGKFGEGEGSVFLLWYRAVKDSELRKKIAAELAAGHWNIETTSYLPLLLYREGLKTEADRILRYLAHPSTPRREYPEVSFAVLEALVEGLMGVEPEAGSKLIRTRFRGKDSMTVAIDQLSILGTRVAVEHRGGSASYFTNQGKTTLRWEAGFEGRHAFIWSGGKRYKARISQDGTGSWISATILYVSPGKTVRAGLRSDQGFTGIR